VLRSALCNILGFDEAAGSLFTLSAMTSMLE